MNQLVPVGTAPAMTVSDVERVAMAIAKGGLFGSKDPNAVLTLCLLAQAEGQHPAVVFRDYHIISGKPAKKAEAMLRDFINAGGKVEWHQLDDTCADATFTHPAGSARISWNHDRAQKAQLAGNAMYKKYPRQMLRSRVISEGIRTVYPGATSGLYEESEVASFDDRPPAHPVTADEALEQMLPGEIIDVTPERQKVQGISGIKKRLNTLMIQGNAATDLATFNVLVHQCKDDLQAIKDGNHDYWTGDGEDSEGFKAWIKRRREELTPKERTTEYQFLVSLVEECTSKNELDAFVAKHGEAVETLDGEESREFEKLYERKEAALKLLATSEA